MQIETQRLILRPWKESDLQPFFEMNNDDKVIQFLRGPMSLEECQQFIADINSKIARDGFGLWATEVKESDDFIGFVGLHIPDFEAHFTPCVEIGWRLASAYWGKGYATEAAQKILDMAGTAFGLKEIVSFTAVDNIKSMAVMERIGMTRDVKDDFYHPKLPKNHPLSKHVLYRKGISSQLAMPKNSLTLKIP